jgi:hypothetical protein
MARSSVAPGLSNQPQWLTEPTGKSEAGATVTDAVLKPTHHGQVRLRLTIEFEDNYREPTRYYRLKYTGKEWINTTPNEPHICKTVINWLEENIETPHLVKT